MTKTRALYLGVIGKKMKPTLNHRPAVWEMMLGTVHAMNDEGVVKYFDYKHEAALEWANVANKSDIRIFKSPHKVKIGSDSYSTKNIRRKQLVLWVEKS